MKVNDNLKGGVSAILAAVTYGMNPFFGIPLYREGMQPLSVLFYRFFFATILMVCIMRIQKAPFRLPVKCLVHTVAGGIFLALTCLFWFMTFQIMDSGIAATLLYIYPVMVALMMFFLYKERLSVFTVSGMILAAAGVVLLCQPGSNANVNVRGIIYIMLSAFTYAVYIVGVKKSRLRELPPQTMTFYTIMFAIPVFLIPLRMGADLQMIPSWSAFGNLAGLAFFTSLLSFLFTAVAIRYIGPTLTSVLGALEPVTAVLIGIFFFGETITLKIFAGIIMIIFAVTVVICGKVSST